MQDEEFSESSKKPHVLANSFSDREFEFIQQAVAFLEKPSFLIQAAQALGKPLEKIQNSLPQKMQKKISEVTLQALQKGLATAIFTLPAGEGIPQNAANSRKFHVAATAVTGAVGGFFGSFALAIELPVTTTIMLRSIASTAHSFGQDLSDPKVQLECLQVFAMGASTSGQSEMESSYFSQRVALELLIKNVAGVGGKGTAREFLSALEKGFLPTVTRLLTRIAARFEIVVSEKFMAEALPILGAVGGATLNILFMDYFNKVAYFHFGLKSLEKKYSAEVVQAAYLQFMEDKTRPS